MDDATLFFLSQVNVLQLVDDEEDDDADDGDACDADDETGDADEDDEDDAGITWEQHCG